MIDLYILDAFDICNSNNGYKNEFQIEQLFALLDGGFGFLTKMNKQLFCSLCNIKEEKDEIFFV